MNKRLLSLISAIFFAVSQGAYAAPVTAVPAALPAADAGQIGVVAAFKGAVTITKPGQVGRIVESGEPIYLGDVISTDSESNLQILLMDETVFTIGPSSAIIIDKFIYDPASEAGKVNAKVVKGVFRFVTGKIARKKPDDMKVELPSGTIGIRGTIVTGKVDGNRSTVILLGPGSQTNTNHRIGQIVVSNQVGSDMKDVRIVRPGFGTVIEGEQVPPTEPFKAPPELLQEITSQLEPQVRSPNAGADDEANSRRGDGSPTEQAGQNKAGAKEPLGQTGKSGRLTQKLSKEVEKAAQSDSSVLRIQDGIARLDDLRRVQSGKFLYSQSGVTLLKNGVNAGGTYDFSYEIDFGNKTAGGNGANSSITANTNGAGTAIYNIPQSSFASGSGLAVFEFTNVPKAGGSCTSCGNAGIVVGINNRDGIIGENVRHSILFSDGNVYRGEDSTNSRTEI